MKKEVKNRWLQINRCKFNIPDPLDYKSYTVAMFIDIKDIARPDNDDGTLDIVYKAKATGELIVQDEHKKVYIKTDKRSQSQKLRAQIIATNDTDQEDTEHYKDMMIDIRHFYPEIKNFIKKLKST
jgi:hypothetical protein